MAPPISPLDFERDLKLYRHSERQARDAKYYANWKLVGSKYIAKQLRRSICYFRMCAEISFRRKVNRQLHHLGHLVEGPQVFSYGGEHVERCDMSGLAALFDIELLPQPAHELWFVSDRGKHAAEI